jgi:YbbR domain-containing protein
VLPSGRLSRRTQWFTRNLGTKSVSLLLACALWFFLAFRVTTVHRTFLVPIECRNLPAGFIIDDPGVAEARVSLTGPERFFPADPSFMTVAVDLNAIRNGTQDIPLTEQCVINKPAGLIVNQVMPRTIKMRAYRMEEISLPVKVVCAGNLPKNLGLAGVKADPDSLRLLVPKSRKADYTELKTDPLALGDIRRSDQVRLNVVLPEHAQFVDGKQASVVAKIEVTEKK